MKKEPVPEPTLPPELGPAAVNCYFGAMTAIGDTMAEVCPHIGAPYQQGLARLRQRVAFQVSEEALHASLRAIQEDLAAFRRRTYEYYTRKSNDVVAVLDLITQAVETFETRDQLYLERVGLAVRQMEAGLGRPEADLREIYARQLNNLKSFSERLAADSQGVFDKLRGEIGAVEDSLLRAEAEASIDPLTSLVNRREIQRLIRDRIPLGKTFSLLIFDVKALRTVNDRFGHDAGDQVLKQFGARLVAQVRPRDIVARWGGDEFAVVFDCAAKDVESRAHQIAQWVSGRYPVTVKGQEWKPEIEASVAILEYRTGEGELSFVSRAGLAFPAHEPDTVEMSDSVEEVAFEHWQS